MRQHITPATKFRVGYTMDLSNVTKHEVYDTFVSWGKLVLIDAQSNFEDILTNQLPNMNKELMSLQRQAAGRK